MMTVQDKQSDALIDDILSFWFGFSAGDGNWDKERAKDWFSSRDSLDLEIKERYEDLLLKASRGQFNHWAQKARGRLALILLLDQFPRNIYRGTESVYRFDSLALELSVEGIALGVDPQLFPIERHFFYLPLMHAESLVHQLLSLFLFDALANHVESSQKEHFLEAKKYANHHFEVIKRFGRFPHRNELLGRESSEEEKRYLSGSFESYGQRKKSKA